MRETSKIDLATRARPARRRAQPDRASGPGRLPTARPPAPPDRPGTVTAEVNLYWLPLGAGGHSVRYNGRVFEWIAAHLARRPVCDLYHAALQVRVGDEHFVIEQAPVPRGDPALRGVVAGGPVGSRWAGRLRLFRYEIRRYRRDQVQHPSGARGINAGSWRVPRRPVTATWRKVNLVGGIYLPRAPRAPMSSSLSSSGRYGRMSAWSARSTGSMGAPLTRR